MILTVPGAKPVTIPVRLPTVAMAGMLLLHVPPTPSLRVIVVPLHSCDGPAIGPGTGFTVNVLVAVQPEGNAYDITVVPSVKPVVKPEPDTIEAIPGAELLQVPPGVASLNVVVSPLQIAVGPIIAESGLTVIVLETAHAEPNE